MYKKPLYIFVYSVRVLLDPAALFPRDQVGHYIAVSTSRISDE
jgi:hypothetical protein